LSITEKMKWGEKYRCNSENKIPQKLQNKWLEKWSIFPDSARILDLASGLGANALYMASQGKNVVAIDIAEDALFALKKNASSKKLNLDLVVADLDLFFLPENYFDGVICFYYLNRKLFGEIRKSLKSGGLFIMETYLETQLNNSCVNQRHKLKQKELLFEFRDFEVLGYIEETSYGIALEDNNQLNSIAKFCARKR